MEMEKQNVIQDTFDALTWDDLRKKSDVLTQRIVEGQDYTDLFPNLAQDIFASLYKGEPSLTEECPSGTEMNRQFVQTLMESEQYDSIRAYTTFDDFSSALACSDVMSEAIEEFKKNPPPKEPPQNPPQEPPQEPPTEPMPPYIPMPPQIVRRIIRKAIKKAEKKAEEREEAFEALGCGNESGERKNMSFEDKETLLEQYRLVKNMAKYIGKYRNLSTSARTERISSTRTELCGVTMGNEVTRALPQELCNLNHPVLQYDFFRKMQERQLLQYELEVNEPTGMGSIVCLVDDSGSMYSENEYLARGIMFGLLECAKKDKRNFAVDIFSYGSDNFCMEIPEGKYTPKQMIDLLSVSYGNGTSFEEPLQYAIDTISKDKFKDADIVIVTDDACHLSDSFVEKLKKFKEEHDVKVTMINVSGYLNETDIKRWVDSVYMDMGDDSITEVYKNI